MSTISHSLLDVVLPSHAAAEPANPALVPVEGEAAFLELANAILDHMAGEPGGAGVLFMDRQTAHGLSPRLPATLANLDVRIQSGELPAWCEGLSAQTWTPIEPLKGGNRFCIAANARAHAAVVAEDANSRLHGVWTTAPETVRALAVWLGATMPAPPPWPAAPESRQAASEQLTLSLARSQAKHRPSRPESASPEDLYSVLEILKAISAERRSSDILYVFAEGVARVVPMERCSVVRIWGNQGHGHVLASHEDERVQDLSIDLALYPEIREVLRTGRKVVIDNAAEAPLLKSVREHLDAAGIASVVVVPIVLDDPEVGTLLLRAARRERAFKEQEVGFFEIVTQAASNALERAHLLENLHLANEHLERLAITDGLTGLYNHRYFIERLEAEVQRAKRYATPLSCIFLDIDDFKEFNDSHGHLMGDAVLRETAQRVGQVMRRVDTVARYGGEELTIILPQTDEDGAARKAEVIRALIADTPFQCGARGISVTVSIGLAAYCPDTMEDHLALCRTADRALYISKRNGKNRVTVGGSHS